MTNLDKKFVEEQVEAKMVLKTIRHYEEYNHNVDINNSYQEEMKERKDL